MTTAPDGGALETGGIVNGRWVGQVWRLADGRIVTITDSGGEGGWILQPTDGRRSFWVTYDSNALVELLLPLLPQEQGEKA